MQPRKQHREVLCCEKCGREVVFLGLDRGGPGAGTEGGSARRPSGCPQCSGDLVGSASVRSFPRPGSAVPSYEILLVDEDALETAEKYLDGCEACLTEYALIPFEYLLDEITVADPMTTQYLLCHPAQCPICHHSITEKTLVAIVTQWTGNKSYSC